MTALREIDGAEAHVLMAALAIYRNELSKARDLGGPALEAAALMDPIAARVQAKVHDALFGGDEPVEPEWDMPESADPITRAKARSDHDDCECHYINRQGDREYPSDYFDGDHYVYERAAS